MKGSCICGNWPHHQVVIVAAPRQSQSMARNCLQDGVVIVAGPRQRKSTARHWRTGGQTVKKQTVSARERIPHQQNLLSLCRMRMLTFFANSESSDDEPTPAELKVLMSTDVEHKQDRYVAREGVTPAAFQRKGNRHVSLPPPSRGRSNQCTSLYFGGDASHWWWPEWTPTWPPPNRAQDH